MYVYSARMIDPTGLPVEWIARERKSEASKSHIHTTGHTLETFWVLFISDGEREDRTGEIEGSETNRERGRKCMLRRDESQTE